MMDIVYNLGTFVTVLYYAFSIHFPIKHHFFLHQRSYKDSILGRAILNSVFPLTACVSLLVVWSVGVLIGGICVTRWIGESATRCHGWLLSCQSFKAGPQPHVCTSKSHHGQVVHLGPCKFQSINQVVLSSLDYQCAIKQVTMRRTHSKQYSPG